VSRPIARNLAVVLASLVAACIVGEASLRIAGFTVPPSNVHNPHRGWVEKTFYWAVLERELAPFELSALLEKIEHLIGPSGS